MRLLTSMEENSYRASVSTDSLLAHVSAPFTNTSSMPLRQQGDKMKGKYIRNRATVAHADDGIHDLLREAFVSPSESRKHSAYLSLKKSKLV